jgi:hypothetical protein
MNTRHAVSVPAAATSSAGDGQAYPRRCRVESVSTGSRREAAVRVSQHRRGAVARAGTGMSLAELRSLRPALTANLLAL